MTKTRAAAVAAAALAVTASVAVGVLTAGTASVAAAPAAVAPAPPATTVRSVVAAAPAVVSVTTTAPVRAAAARHATPARKATPKAVAKPAARPVTKPVVNPVTKPAVKAQAKAAPSPVPAPAATTADDYPWRTSAGTSPDTWGFTQRQCVSFAAFRLAKHGHAISTSQGWGSALNWDETARRRGVTVTTTPRVGAVAQWNAGESSSVAGGGRFTAGSYGHVGYVAAVYADGTALVEQYNLGGSRSYTALRMTAPRYLVF